MPAASFPGKNCSPKRTLRHPPRLRATHLRICGSLAEPFVRPQHPAHGRVRQDIRHQRRHNGQRKGIQHCGVRGCVARCFDCLARPSRQSFVEMQLDAFVARTGKQRLSEPFPRICLRAETPASTTIRIRRGTTPLAPVSRPPCVVRIRSRPLVQIENACGSASSTPRPTNAELACCPESVVPRWCKRPASAPPNPERAAISSLSLPYSIVAHHQQGEHIVARNARMLTPVIVEKLL